MFPLKLIILRKLPFIFLSILSFIFLFIPLLKADTITIAADEWAPYNAIPNSKKPGYGIEIAKKIFEKEGHKVEYSLKPWSRAIVMSRKGKYNAIIGAFKEDAPDFVFPSEEFGISKTTFFVKQESLWKYDGLNSLLNKKIALIKDYSNGEEFDKFFNEHPEIVSYAFGTNALPTNIKKLNSNFVDIVLEDKNVFLEKAKSMGLENKFKISGSTNNIGNKVYLAFSPNFKKSKEYAQIFSKGIKELKESGELKKILDKYGLTYWK